VRVALEEGRSAAALASAIAGGDLDLAVDVLRVGWFALLRDDGGASIRDVLEPLSSTQLMSHPLLAMALGLAFNVDGARRSKSVYYFGLAAAGVRRHQSRLTPAERALVLASESAALRLMGKTTLSVASARAGLRALEAILEERSELIGYLPRLYSQLGTSLYYGGQEAEALHVFTRGYAEAGPEDLSSFGNLAMAAGIHALGGNLSEATERVILARGEPWTDQQRSMYPGTFYRIAEAVLALERFDATCARTHLDAMIHDRRSIEHWTVIARVQALSALLAGDPALGLVELEDYVVLRGAEGGTRTTRHRLSSVRSLLHIALGNYEAAGAILRADAGDRAQDHVDRARLALATDRLGDAFKELRSIAGRPQSARTTAESLAIEAAAGLRTGRDRRTTAVLRQLATTLRVSGQRIALHLLTPDDLNAVSSGLADLNAADVLDVAPCAGVMQQPDRPALTPRELAVLNALGRTATVSEIADELYVSPNTVKSQLRSLYRKLGAGNRDEALAVALHRHLISAAEVRTTEPPQ
jgi:LuxR family maltose regulon positive regulatory protein